MSGPGGQEVGRISIRVVPDTSFFRQKLKAELEAIEHSMEAKIKVVPEMDHFRSKVAAQTQGMRTSVKVDADTGDFRKRMGKLFTAPNFGSGINMSGYAVILAGITALAGPIVGLLTTSLLALPGLIAGVATPIAAITLGLDGMKNAVSVLATPFANLKTIMNGVNEKAFTPMFETLGKIFPTLEKAMPSVSKGLADIGSSIAETLTSPDNMVKIERSILNIGESLRRAAPGFGSFTDGIVHLVDEFTKKMPDLGDWFSNTGKDFVNWIKGVDLKTAFEGLGTTIKTILDGLGQIASKGMEFMSDPAKLENFKQGLQGIANLLTQIVDLSGKINGWKPPEWLNIEPGKESPMGAFPGMQPKNPPKPGGDEWSGGFLDDLETAMAKIPEKLGELKNKLLNGENFLSGDMMPDFSAWTEKMIAPFQTAWNTISTNAQAAWNQVVGVVQSAASRIVSVGQSIASGLAGVWNSIVGAAQAAWNGVLNAVVTVVTGVTSAVQNGVSQVVGFFQSMGGQIISAITSINLASAGSALMDGLLSGIKAGAQKVYDFVSGIAGKIAALKGPLPYDRKVLIPNGGALMEGLGTGIENGLDPVLGKVKSIAQQIFQAFKEVFGEGKLPNIAFNLGGISDGMGAITAQAQDMGKALETNLGAASAGGPNKIGQAAQGQLDDLELQKDTLELQKQQLTAERNQLDKKDKAGRAAIQQQIDQLNAQKQALTLQATELKNQEKWGTQQTDNNGLMDEYGKKVMDATTGFAMANANQFMQDLGMSGDGALPALAKYGMEFGQKFVFNVSNIDEAMTVKQNETNKQALQYNRR